jgi:DNA-binding response OmpR family regulator
VTFEARPLRILVIDDEPAMVGAVAALVGSVGYRVVPAYDGREALARYDAERPDVVLLDLAMPQLDGLSVCRALRQRGDTPIIILSGENEEAAKVEALDAGADDYVTKPFGKQELLARVRAVLRRRGTAGGDPEPVLTAAGGFRVDRRIYEARYRDRLLGLTKVEFELLAALVEARGRLVSHAELLRAGWPEETDPDPLWPKPHLTRLRAKLAAAGAPPPVSVRGVGYRLIEPRTRPAPA